MPNNALIPGRPVKNSKSGQPIMVALDLLGRKWALRVLWQLRDGNKRSFREIQSQCEITSPNVLTSRLKELRDTNIVVLEEAGGYKVTETGMRLLQAIEPLAQWSEDWAKQVGREDLNCYSKSKAATPKKAPKKI